MVVLKFLEKFCMIMSVICMIVVCINYENLQPVWHIVYLQLIYVAMMIAVRMIREIKPKSRKKALDK